MRRAHRGTFLTMADFRPAPPTLDRIERFYALVADIGEASALEPETPEGDAEEPESLGAIARATTPTRPEARTFDSAALCRELYERGRLREFARVVLVNGDGSDLTKEDAGRVLPSALEDAAPFYLIALHRLQTMFGGGVSDAGSTSPAGHPDANGSTTSSETSASGSAGGST